MYRLTAVIWALAMVIWTVRSILHPGVWVILDAVISGILVILNLHLAKRKRR